MKYGKVSGDLMAMDYHAKGDSWLLMQKDQTVFLTDTHSFRFIGTKKEIREFLKKFSGYRFKSQSGRVHVAIGEVWKPVTPAEAIGKRLAGALMPDIPTVVSTALEMVPGVQSAKLIVDLHSRRAPSDASGKTHEQDGELTFEHLHKILKGKADDALTIDVKNPAYDPI